MTTQERNKWAEAREEMIKFSEINSRSFEEINSALFVLSLEDELGEKQTDINRNCLHGDGRNRFFDKSFSLLVDKNGISFFYFYF